MILASMLFLTFIAFTMVAMVAVGICLICVMFGQRGRTTMYEHSRMRNSGANPLSRRPKKAYSPAKKSVVTVGLKDCHAFS